LIHALIFGLTLPELYHYLLDYYEAKAVAGLLLNEPSRDPYLPSSHVASPWFQGVAGRE
jgi:hypothetical protein